MTKLLFIVPLLSVVIANGFTSSSLPPTTFSRYGGRTCNNNNVAENAQHPSFLLQPRGGASSPLSSTTTTETSIDIDIGPSLDVISTSNWELLSERGKAAISKLILYDMSSGHHGQKHVFGDWPEVGVDDEEKIMLAEQVSVLCFALTGSSTLFPFLFVNKVHAFRSDELCNMIPLTNIHLFIQCIDCRPRRILSRRSTSLPSKGKNTPPRICRWYQSIC